MIEYTGVAMFKTERLLTLCEAEQLTGRKVSTWRKDIRLRKVPYVRLGRQIRIPIEAVREL
ncbi:MAG: hypothetical protein ABIU05_25805, partial [Nitrospirales bacterium]